ncbi:MAG: sulfatase-like hydrolase/transferase [Verrucomicrobia bacterium]|nr:sulfatase-like hydrolase/transferase [Verrucomicrobiota bacterium]
MVHRLSCLSLTWILLGLLQSLHGAQPNFLFILVDDLGKMDLSCEGSTYHETPHIDALARRSMRFDQGYSACQVCSPSRASIQTGQYPARLGITDYIAVNRGNQPGKMDSKYPFIAS